MSRQFSAALWSLAAAIPILLIANASPSSGWAADTSMLLLAVTFLASVMALAIASTAQRMQLSLQLITIYFTVYLLLPGYNHASINIFPFFDFSYPDDVRTSAALMVMLFMITVAIGYTIMRSRSDRMQIRGTEHLQGRTMRDNAVLGTTLTLTSMVSMIVFLTAVGVSAAFGSRESLDTAASGLAGASFLITVPRVLTFLPVIYGTLLIKFSVGRRLGFSLLAINSPIFLIVNYPLSLPRSQVFGIILVFMLLTINFKMVSRRAALSAAYVFGALIAMPILNHFSRNGETFDTLDLKQLALTYFKSGDFDGYQSIANAVLYVDRFGLSHGIQVISASLFFIPRALWAGKGDPTGSLTAEAAGYTFVNVSQPLPSEFYVDFGWAGVVLGGLLLGAAFFSLDRWIDRCWTLDLRTRLAAGWLMGFGLPILRGTLLGVLPPLVIVAAGLWIISRWGMVKTVSSNLDAQFATSDFRYL